MKFVIGLLSFDCTVCLILAIVSVQQLAKECKIIRENLDQVTARFMSSEELIEEKVAEIKEMEAKIRQLEETASTVPVLQQQVSSV